MSSGLRKPRKLRKRQIHSSKNTKSRSRGVVGFNSHGAEEDESETFAPPIKEDDDNDYDCSPPGSPFPFGSFVQAPTSDTGNIISETVPCVTCKPCPYWEREIVKYNADGKWDPKISEKDRTGRPNLKGEHKNDQDRTQNSNNHADRNSSSVPLGEPCNSYRCYLDPCVPRGYAYCTLKHFHSNLKEYQPCQPRFPAKLNRIPICHCPGRQNSSGSESFGETGRITLEFHGESTENELVQPDCSGLERGFDLSNQIIGADGQSSTPHCSSNSPNLSNLEAQNSHLYNRPTGSYPAKLQSTPKQKIKTPEEWLMQIPPCTDSKFKGSKSREHKGQSKRRRS